MALAAAQAAQKFTTAGDGVDSMLAAAQAAQKRLRQESMDL